VSQAPVLLLVAALVAAPGDYTVSFSREGFTVSEHTVRVGLGFTADVDVALTIEAQASRRRGHEP
jgi:hypothetical protein